MMTLNNKMVFDGDYYAAAGERFYDLDL